MYRRNYDEERIALLDEYLDKVERYKEEVSKDVYDFMKDTIEELFNECWDLAYTAGYNNPYSE